MHNRGISPALKAKLIDIPKVLIKLHPQILRHGTLGLRFVRRQAHLFGLSASGAAEGLEELVKGDPLPVSEQILAWLVVEQGEDERAGVLIGGVDGQHCFGVDLVGEDDCAVGVLDQNAI